MKILLGFFFNLMLTSTIGEKSHTKLNIQKKSFSDLIKYTALERSNEITSIIHEENFVTGFGRIICFLPPLFIFYTWMAFHTMIKQYLAHKRIVLLFFFFTYFFFINFGSELTFSFCPPKTYCQDICMSRRSFFINKSFQ